MAQLKRQANELLHDYLAGRAGGIAEIARFYQDADPVNVALHHAQLVLARSYGLDSWPMAFAAAALDSGARLDLRDHLLNSTPLGSVCRWGREELVELFLERGADPLEKDAETWATPLSWARKKGHHNIVAMIQERLRSTSRE